MMRIRYTGGYAALAVAYGRKTPAFPRTQQTENKRAAFHVPIR